MPQTESPDFTVYVVEPVDVLPPVFPVFALPVFVLPVLPVLIVLPPPVVAPPPAFPVAGVSYLVKPYVMIRLFNFVA